MKYLFTRWVFYPVMVYLLQHRRATWWGLVQFFEGHPRLRDSITVPFVRLGP